VNLEQLLAGLAVLLVVLALGLLAGAILLRAACALCRVQTPRFGKAFVVVVLVALVNGGVAVGVSLLFWNKPAEFGWPGQLLLSIFLFLVDVAIYTSWLQVSFGKGALIRLTEAGIVLAIGAVLLGGVYAVQLTRAWVANAPNRPAARMAKARLDMEQAEQAAGQGDAAEAGRLFAIAAAVWGQLASEFPGKPDYRRQQASCLTRQAEALLSRQDRFAETAAVFHKALTLWQQLATEFPDVPDYPPETDQCRQHLQELADRVRRMPQTEAGLREALAFYKQRANDAPEDSACRRDLAGCCTRLAILLARGDAGARQEADQSFRDALVLWKGLAAEFPAAVDYQRERARTTSDLADLLRRDPKARREVTVLCRETLVLVKPLAVAPSAVAADRRLLAWTYLRLGDLVYRPREPQEAESAYREAGTLFQRLAAESIREPGDRLGLGTTHLNMSDLLAQTGRPQEALARVREGVTLLRQLTQDVPGQRHYHHELALACNRLGDLLAETGRLPEAEPAYREALTLSESLVANHPTEAEYRRELARSYNNLGNWYARSGRSQEAVTALNKAQTLFKQLVADFPSTGHRRDLAICAHDLGTMLSGLEMASAALELLDRAARNLNASWFQTANPHQAEQAFHQALNDWNHQRIEEDLAREPEYHRAVAQSCDQLARMSARDGKPWDAQRFSQDAVAAWKELVAEYPARIDFRRELARSLTARGEQIAALTGLARTTAEAFRDARDLWKELAAQFPDVPEYRQELAKIRKTLIELSHRVLQAEQPRVSLGGMEFFEQVVRDFSDEPPLCQDLAEALSRRGAEALANGWRGVAEQAFRKAGDLWQGLVTRFPTEPDYRKGLARSRYELGNFYREYRQTREAETSYGEAQALLRQLSTDFPRTVDYRHELARVYNSRGQLLERAGRRTDAEAAYRDAVVVSRQLVADSPSVPAYRQELASSLTHVGRLLWLTRRRPEAESAYRDALGLWKQLVVDFPAVPDYRREQANGLNLLGVVLLSSGQLQEAEAAHRDAQSLEQNLVADFPKTVEFHNDLAGTMLHLAVVLRARGQLDAARELLEQARVHHQAVLEARPYDATYRQSFRSNRVALIDTLLHQGQHAAAAAAIKDLPSVAVNQAPEAYQAAGLLARCAALAGTDAQLPETRRGELARSYGERAVGELRRAMRGGLRSARLLKENKNLDVLRSRADFQKLLAEVEAKPGPGKK
jgi:tetratricopeptide (TPR) repeat protein